MTIWNLTSLKKPECIRVLDHRGGGSGTSVTSCIFSGCGSLLATGDAEGCCRLFEVRGWNPLNSIALRPPHATLDCDVMQSLMGHSGPLRAITCVSFSPDSKMLATASLDTSVRIWQEQSSRHWVSGYSIQFPGPVNFIQFAPMGLQVVANCLNDDRAYVWDLALMLKHNHAWHYQVLDCGDDKVEIVCTAAAW